jgi:hypothetical protein
VTTAKPGAPTRVRVNGKVITIPHQKDWEHLASAFLSQGTYILWARRVLSPEDLQVFEAAALHNYQMDAIVRQVTENSGITPGKQRRSPRSSGSTRRG